MNPPSTAAHSGGRTSFRACSLRPQSQKPPPDTYAAAARRSKSPEATCDLDGSKVAVRLTFLRKLTAKHVAKQLRHLVASLFSLNHKLPHANLCLLPISGKRKPISTLQPFGYNEKAISTYVAGLNLVKHQKGKKTHANIAAPSSFTTKWPLNKSSTASSNGLRDITGFSTNSQRAFIFDQ